MRLRRCPGSRFRIGGRSEHRPTSWRLAGYVMGPKPKPLRERFMSKVDVTGDCWEWTAAKYRNGYGRLRVGSLANGTRRMALAHRVSFEMFNGPIPGEAVVMHVCDNPGCVNPGHLRAGTQKDNIRDCVAKGRHRPGAGGARTPQSGEKNGNAKLSAADVELIRRVVDSGEAKVHIATRFGISDTHVARIANRENWRD